MATTIDISTPGPTAGGPCHGGPYHGELRAYFRTTMPVVQELKGYIGAYHWIAGGWRWAPINLNPPNE